MMPMLARIIPVLTFLFLSVQVSAGVIELNSSLLKASSRGDTALARELLAKGADVDTRDKLGNTPLILAADAGYQEIARVLINHKAAVNAMNKYGYTPLLSAVANSHRYLASLLIAAGADPDIPNRYGTTPRIYMKAKGFFTINEYISSGEPAMSAVIDTRTARRGTMGAIHNPAWREEFNRLVSAGQGQAAADYLISVASKDNYEAQYLLGMLLLEKNNTDKGVAWLKKAAASSDSKILYDIGKVFTNDDYVYIPDLGATLLKSSMDMGSELAAVEYAKCLLFGIGVTRDYNAAYSLFKQNAEKGLSEALFYTGYMTFAGKGAPLDEARGLEIIKSAAKSGFAEAAAFIKRIQTEDIIKEIAKTEVADRAKMKSRLISSNAPLISGATGCDTYSLFELFEKSYGLEKLELCYKGDGKVGVKYYTSLGLDSDVTQYLKRIAGGAEFSNETE